MNDIQILSAISKNIGREVVEGKEPQIGKITFCKDINERIIILNLSTCNLLDETIPDEIWNLSYLEELSLDNNQLLTFPVKIIQLKNLKKLNIQNNQFQVISKEIGNLTNLEELELSDNKLQTLPKEMGKLNNLKKLRLNDNLLTTFPELQSKYELINLISIDLDYAKVKELPKWIFQLRSLRFLSLTGLRLNRFPLSVCHLKNLEHLYLDSTYFPEWPDSIEFPTKLKLLVLDGAKIKQIPKAIIKLKPLYIRNQRSYEQNYSGLQVALGNLFSELDEGLLLSKDNEISYQYLKSLYSKEGFDIERHNYRSTDIKVVLLGAGAAGKSSLVQRLCYSNPDDDNIPLSPVQTTHGVNIDYHITIKEVLDKVNNQVNDFTLHFWDFGGQDKYMGINKLLLTDKAVYIIVIDSRTNVKPDIWLSMIQTYAPNALILFVVNKMDESFRTSINFEYYYEKYYPQIYNCLFKISCLYPSQGINKISEIITALRKIISLKMDALAPVWSPNWLNVKVCIEKKYLVDKKVIIDKHEYKDLCYNNAIYTEEEQNALLNILNISGTCILFNNNRKSILNPNWIADYLYVLYNHLPIQEAVLDYEEYLSLTNNIIEYREYAIDLLSILEERGLCIVFYQYVQRRQIKKVFCPIFLHEKCNHKSAEQFSASLTYIFKAAIPPDLEFQIFITKMFPKIYKKKWDAWQYGFYFFSEVNNSEILITLLENELVLKIWSEGDEKCGNSFLEIKTALQEISETDFFEEYIVVINEQNCETLLPYKTLHSLYKLGIERYYLPQNKNPGNLITIDVKSLGKKCGLETDKYGIKNTHNEIKKNIQKVEVIMKVNKMNVKGDYIEHGGKNVIINGSPKIINDMEQTNLKQHYIEEIQELAQQIKNHEEVHCELACILKDIEEKQTLKSDEVISVKQRVEHWASNVANIITISSIVPNIKELLYKIINLQ